jgi:hypothetical protein
MMAIVKILRLYLIRVVGTLLIGGIATLWTFVAFRAAIEGHALWPLQMFFWLMASAYSFHCVISMWSGKGKGGDTKGPDHLERKQE